MPTIAGEKNRPSTAISSRRDPHSIASAAASGRLRRASRNSDAGWGRQSRGQPKLFSSGQIDAFALSRDQLNAMAKKIPGTRVLDETFKQTVTAVAVPPNHPQALAFAAKFLTDAIGNGTLRKAYDDNGLKETPIRTQTK